MIHSLKVSILTSLLFFFFFLFYIFVEINFQREITITEKLKMLEIGLHQKIILDFESAQKTNIL